MTNSPKPARAARAEDSEASQEAPQGDLPPDPHLPPSPPGVTSTQSVTGGLRVFVVVDAPRYEESEIIGVFSSYEAALTFREKHTSHDGRFKRLGDFEIEEWEVDGGRRYL